MEKRNIIGVLAVLSIILALGVMGEAATTTPVYTTTTTQAYTTTTPVYTTTQAYTWTTTVATTTYPTQTTMQTTTPPPTTVYYTGTITYTTTTMEIEVTTPIVPATGTPTIEGPATITSPFGDVDIEIHVYSDGSITLVTRQPSMIDFGMYYEYRTVFNEDSIETYTKTRIEGETDLRGLGNLVVEKQADDTLRVEGWLDIVMDEFFVGRLWYNASITGTITVAGDTVRVTATVRLATNDSYLLGILSSGNIEGALEDAGVTVYEATVTEENGYYAITLDVAVENPDITPLSLSGFFMDFQPTRLDWLDYMEMSIRSGPGWTEATTETRLSVSIDDYIEYLLEELPGEPPGYVVAAAERLEIVPGSEMIFKMEGGETVFISPRVKAKGTDDPHETLRTLKSIAALADYWDDPEVKLVPGDDKVKAIDPSRVRISELDTVTVVVEKSPLEDTRTLALAAAGIIAVIVIGALAAKRF